MSRLALVPRVRRWRHLAVTGETKTVNMAASGTVWYQREVSLKSKKRGCHLVTDEIVNCVPEIGKIKMGLCHFMIKHTSASLSLNENWDPSVRTDMEKILTRLVPEGPHYEHSCEGPDDMPAHAKACFMGASLSVPVTDGKLNVGTWQGIWLNEHRDHGGSRKVMVTLQGAPK